MRVLRRVLGDADAVGSPPSIRVDGPHEAFLVYPVLRGTVPGALFHACSVRVREPLTPRERRKRVVEDRQAARQVLTSTSLVSRAVLLLPVVLLFIPVMLADAWDTWAAQLVLAVLAVLILGAATAAVRLLALQIASEARSRPLEPWNGDLVWQSVAIAAAWVLVSLP